MDTTNKFYIYTPPIDSGCWVINQSLRIYVQKRPNWFYRKIVKLILGWDWEHKK
jgi:hypothetical protein